MRSVLLLFLTLLVAACGNQAEKSPDEEPEKNDQKDDSDDTPRSRPNPARMLSALLASQADKPGLYDSPRQSDSFDGDKSHVLILELSGPLVELASYSPFSGFGGTEKLRLAKTLDKLAKNEKVAGILLRLDGLAVSTSDAEELRQLLRQFRGDTRKLWCHVESASTTLYYLLTACDSIAIAPGGLLEVSGAAVVPLHAAELLASLGITADFIHVGAYKGAAEPLTRSAPSKELRQTLDAIVDVAYSSLIDAIASGRKIERAAVTELVDRALFPATAALEAKLVDRVATFDAYRDEIAGDRPWKKQSFVGNKLSDFSNFTKLLGLTPARRSSSPHIALIYAVGPVVDGRGDGIMATREEIASRPLASAIRTVADDDAVKAIVLRISSGGGSALASELIWREVAAAAKKKPVVASMGTVAASGGYYIASAATEILALDNTITGSIGVVGGKLVFGDGLARVGIRGYPIARGKRAAIWSPLSVWTPEERSAVEAMMKTVYEQFLERVAEGRKKPIDEIRKVAEGRAWTGKDALAAGLIDRVGGLEEALAKARELGEVPADAELEVYPPDPTLVDIVRAFATGGVRAPVSTELAPLWATLPDSTREAATKLARAVLRFRSERIQTIWLPAFERP